MLVLCNSLCNHISVVIIEIIMSTLKGTLIWRGDHLIVLYKYNEQNQIDYNSAIISSYMILYQFFKFSLNLLERLICLVLI